MNAKTIADLSTYVRTFYDLQKLRIQTSNRVKTLEEEKDDDSISGSLLMQNIKNRLESFEQELEGKIRPQLKEIKIYNEYLRGIKGCGPLLSASIVSEIGRLHVGGEGIAAFDNPSKLIKYSGVGPREIYKDHKYNWFLKMTLLGEQKLIDQFILHKHKNAYDRYLRLKEIMRTKYPEKIVDEKGKTKYNDGHISNMAKKELANMFLIHLWQVWRKFENLEVKQPYVQSVLQHQNIITDPFEFWVDKPNMLVTNRRGGGKKRARA
jgi:hypothetical protein